MADQEIEYESDPEEAKLSLKLRRREASDDEEEERDGGGNRGEKPPRRIDDDSDGESEGAAAEYEDGEEDYDLDEEEYLEDEIEVAGVVYDVGGGGGGGMIEAAGVPASGVMEERKELSNDAHEIANEDSNIADGEHEGDKKEIEPFAVPTAGAFYMHDDRFRDNARGRNRRTLGVRKLWESKDDKKWGHDKFEELSMHERHHDEPRRGSRGRYRGRGRNRGAGRGYAQGSRPREYTNNNISQSNNNQKNTPKGVRGRGPRRYQPSKNNNEAPIAQKNQYGKSMENHSNVSTGKTTQAVSNSASVVVQPKKQVASNLNIASPPFYPTGSSSKESVMPLKTDVQASTSNRNSQQSVVDESSNIARSMRGKNSVDSIGVDKLYIDDSASAMIGNPRSTMQVSVTGPMHINSPQPQFRGGQGRGLNSMAHVTYRPDLSSNQTNKVPQPSPPQSFQRNSGQSRAQSSGPASVQQFTQRLPAGLQASSPPKAAGSVNSFESGDQESASDSSQVKTTLVTKGKGVVPGGGKGSFLYGSPQAMGATGRMTSPDQNFPTFLPVMQFGAQHPGGIGVPAVGMAFPGYVGQPQLGLGSSEMTWLPVLAGAAGALGATYCPPYITVDGSYNARPSGQAPSTTAASSKETSTTKSSNDWNSPNPELASEDFGQRQKNPRRYTEMKFDQ